MLVLSWLDTSSMNRCCGSWLRSRQLCFFFNDTATTEIYTLSLHDALPICRCARRRGEAGRGSRCRARCCRREGQAAADRDRKSTRLNSSHQIISYAVFCLKKKIQPRLASLYQRFDAITAHTAQARSTFELG